MVTHSKRADKHCQSCGRPFSWRKKWERDWDNVRYCSRACRQTNPARDKELEDTILLVLQQRKDGTCICPSEAARQVEPTDWRELMEPTRRAARRLSLRGKIEVTQQGRVVKDLNFRGPIRLRLKQQ